MVVVVVIVWVHLDGWLNDFWVLFIVRVTLGVLIRLGDVVVERWEFWAWGARLIWPVPSVCHWLHTFKNWPALVNESGGIGVLVAHLNDDCSVNILVFFKRRVARFQIVKSIGGLLEVPLVLFDLILVILDVTGVLINVRGVLVAESLGVLNSVLEVGSGESESFGSNQHVGGLGNLELVVLCAEESFSVLESLNLLGEAWESQIGGRCVTSVVVVVLVVIRGLWIGNSGGDQKGGSEGFHCILKFIDYKDACKLTFMNAFLNF